MSRLKISVPEGFIPSSLHFLKSCCMWYRTISIRVRSPLTRIMLTAAQGSGDGQGSESLYFINPENFRSGQNDLQLLPFVLYVDTGFLFVNGKDLFMIQTGCLIFRRAFDW